MKYYFIINKASGDTNKNHIERKIHKVCINRGIPYEILYTKSAGDGKNLAKNIDDSEECVVFSVGGDGNLNDVLNGIIGSKNKILGNIPSGSGNDFQKTLQKYHGQIITSDVGMINGRYFINVACIGLDADVANNLESMKSKKWIPTSQRYNASLITTFFKYRFKKLNIQIGDFITDSWVTILAVGNGQYYGGGYRIAPQAMIDDGVFDIYVVRKMPKIRILGVLLRLLKGTHEKSPTVKRYRNDEMIIDCEEEYAFNVDGEVLKGKRFEIKVVKNAVRVFNDKTFVEEIIKKENS